MPVTEPSTTKAILALAALATPIVPKTVTDVPTKDNDAVEPGSGEKVVVP
jgi:hypothetical protein